MVSGRTFLVFASAAIFACGGTVAFTACSSSQTAIGDGDNGDATTDTKTPSADAEPEPEDDGGPTPAEQQCIDQCFAKYPASKAKYDAVDACWAANCKGPCLDETGAYDGGVDAAAHNDGGNPLCQTDISSGIDKSCDDCTEGNCCAAWQGCYTDTDCLALTDCVGVCNP